MNNKSDKKHKRKQKQKKPKTKKKTASRQSKKKTEIKGGGLGWFKGLFSGKTDESSKMNELRQHLLQNPQNNASSALPNPQQLVYSNLQQSVSSNGSYNSTTKTPSNQNNWNKQKLAELKQSLLSNSKRFANAQPTNSNNSQRTVSQTQPSTNSRNSQQNVSQTLSPANSNNSQRTALQNPQSANSRTLPQNTSQAPASANLNTHQPNVLPVNSNNSPPPPRAQPQGFNTLKAQSRCSIM